VPLASRDDARWSDGVKVTAHDFEYAWRRVLRPSTASKSVANLYTLKKSENSLLVDDLMPTPHKVNPSVPEPLSNLVMECVRVNPLKRPKGMNDVARRLEIMRHVLEKDSGPDTVAV